MLSTPHLHIHNLDLPPGLHADVKRGLRQGSVSYGLCGVILNDRDVKEFANYLEQHHVCSLSASGHTLTVSRAYGDEGHGGTTWTLSRVLDCGGEALSAQLFARTYKYVDSDADASSATAYEAATRFALTNFVVVQVARELTRTR